LPFSQTAGTVTGTETVVLGVLVAVSSTTSVAVPSVCTMVIEYVQEVTNNIVKTIRAMKNMLVYANLKLSMLILGFTSLPFLCSSTEPTADYHQLVLKEQTEIKYNLVKDEIAYKYRTSQRQNELNMLATDKKHNFIVGYFTAYAEMYYFLDKLENDEY